MALLPIGPGIESGPHNANYAYLEEKINEHKADTVSRSINVMYPPAPLVAAVLDGETDDAPAINGVVNYLSALGGGTVYIPRGTCKLTSTHIDLKSNIEIVGAPGSVIDMSGVALSGGYRHGIRAAGSTGASINLSTNANKGEYSVSLSSVSGLSAGDYLVLATQGANYYPYNDSPAYNVDRGEIKRIRNIDGTVVYFEEAIYDNYTTANSAFVKKVTFVENVRIRGLKIVGDEAPDSSEMGIHLSYVNGFTIEGCDLENQDLYQIGLISCIRGSIINNRLRQSYYDGITGTIFYAIALVSACQWIRISDTHAERNRHHTVLTSLTTGQGHWGKPRFIVVDGCIAKDMMGGDSGRSWAFEHHGFGDGIIFSNCIADGCYGGFNIEGGSVKIIGCAVRNWYYSAVEIENQGVDLHDITIEHLEIGDSSVEGGGHATPRALMLNVSAAVEPLANLKIHGLIIRQNLEKANAIYLVGNSGDPIDGANIVIENVEIYNTGVAMGDNYGVNIGNVKGVSLRNLKVYDSQQAIYISSNSDECILENIEMDVLPTRTVSSGYGIYIGAKDCWVTNCKIRRSYYGIRVEAGVTGAVLANNIIRSDAVTISDGGTATTKQNNIEIVY